MQNRMLHISWIFIKNTKEWRSNYILHALAKSLEFIVLFFLVLLCIIKHDLMSFLISPKF